ncbi:GIY-YIG nuclease family protein [Microbacterium sp. K35]|uniref:GIY-YIG nuclease family protein n=1 Tax=Microbacterium sp. K35 TaxID=2305440 RepID=UPI00109B92AB|nr:GIY-YIG nuclease family protein [Microbacterium sp. K35]
MGAVYILHNCAFPQLVKIGMTTGSPEARAKQLYSTGVPSPFVVLYAQSTENPRKLERAIHAELAEFRDTQNREFFRTAPRRAIDTLLRLASAEGPAATTTEVDVTERLRRRWGVVLAPDLVSAVLRRTRFGMTVVATFQRAGEEVTTKSDLEMVWDDNGPIFGPDADIDTAASLLEDIDAVTLVLVTDLIHPSIADAIRDARDHGVDVEEIDGALDVVLSFEDTTAQAVVEEIDGLERASWEVASGFASHGQ